MEGNNSPKIGWKIINYNDWHSTFPDFNIKLVSILLSVS